MAQKKVPMRQCIGCREMKPKRELIRVVKSPEGVISLDPKGKLPGRGTYLCPQATCLAKARMERAFSAPIPPEIYESLEAQLEAELHG